MSALSKKRFTFTWQIQNFSMCPQKFKEGMFSPVFVVAMLDDSEWQLELFPRGSRKENTLSCFLHCISIGDGNYGVQIRHSYTIFSTDARKLITRELQSRTFTKDDKRGRCLISRSDIFDERKVYLPNDTLVIQLSLWRKDDEEGEGDSDSEEDSESEDYSDRERDPKEVANEMFATDSENNSQYSTQYNECSVVTYVQMHRKNVSWPIRNFSSVGDDERLEIHVPTTLKNAPSFDLTLWKSIEEQSVDIKIYAEQIKSLKGIFVKCKISLLQTPKSIGYSYEDDHLFEYEDVASRCWKVPYFLEISKLQEAKYFSKTNDVLHLRFEFSVSHLDDIYHMEKVSFFQCGTFVNLSEPIEEFKHMYKDEELSDVTIKGGNRDFKVHKIILKARSPVFGAMFDSDMKENLTGIVDIPNVDPDTLDRMLLFMYSNALEDLKAEDALKLYAAANEFQVLSLKFRCTWIIASRIAVSNVCEVLILADEHSDDFLRDCAESFIRGNSMEIFKSRKWKNLIENHGTLAANVMLQILTN